MKFLIARKAVVAAISVSVTISACRDDAQSPDDSSRLRMRSSSSSGAASDVAEVRIDLPPKPVVVTGDSLIAAITRGESVAVIGIKEPASAHAAVSGIRKAISRGAVLRAVDEIGRVNGVQITDLFDRIGLMRVRITSRSALDALRNNPHVDFIEARTYGHVATQDTAWGIRMVAAPQMWSLTTGSGSKLQIIDSGHQRGHPDLPYLPTGNCGGAYNGCVDTLGHGTLVLGIAAALNNSTGVVGIAHGMSANSIYSYAACNSTGSCSTDEVIAGINAGIANSVEVINMSLSLGYSMSLATAVAQAWSNDIVMIAAAGNNGGNLPVYPVEYSNVIGVSGVWQDSVFVSSNSLCGNTSNYGGHVDLSAPFYANSTFSGSQYVTACGTSMAAPHVAGVAALLRAKYPGWSNQQVVSRLLSTAIDRGSPGRDDYYGYGLVNAERALTAFAAISGPSEINDNYVCNWSARSGRVTGSLTYSWKRDGVEVSTSSYYFANTPGGTFQLTLTITDAEGVAGSSYLNVYENSSAPDCALRR